MTADEAAEWLGMPDKGDTLEDWAGRGKIGFYKPSKGIYLFSEVHLWEYLRDREHQPKPLGTNRCDQGHRQPRK